MNEFHRTPMGRKFYESDLPKLINALEKISSKLEEANKLNEKRYKLEERLMRYQLKELNEKINIESNNFSNAASIRKSK